MFTNPRQVVPTGIESEPYRTITESATSAPHYPYIDYRKAIH